MTSPEHDQQDSVLQSRDLASIFRLWEEKYTTSGFDPVPILTRLSELFEEETEIYMQKDPDPFDERHPSRTDPECELGRMLKLLFRKDHFMTRLMNDYLRDNFFTRQNIQKSSFELNVAACRLILVIMPGLETSAVFQVEFDYLIHRLYAWAENSMEPLQSYATGLLAAAMEVQDIATGFREQNTNLLPIMLKRLHSLQATTRNILHSKFAEFSTIHDLAKTESNDDLMQGPSSPEPGMESSKKNRAFSHLGGGSAPTSPDSKSDITSTMNGIAKFKNSTNLNTLLMNEISLSNQESKSYVRNIIPIHPPTTATSQMLILRYLASMGEYQEFLGQVFENNAMNLILRYIENLDPKETCLAFEALKYLASLLCHKKFSLEFVNNGGLERLLQIPRPSVAATGVSISLYYLAYCEDAMERICSMPQKFISELVSYALWLLGCSHDSGRCHATMFFGLSFQFKVILDEFDQQDGLRKLYNVISVLPILSTNDELNLNDDEECAARQLVRHVCVALKKYIESHLYYKYIQVTRQQTPNSYSQQTTRATKSTPEGISDQVRTLQEMLPMRAHWAPVDKLLALGGVTLLLRIIAVTDWNYTGRGETVRSALDALSICCVIPRVHQVFCERIELPDKSSAAGINVILGAAEGEIVADAEVQKSALAVLVHCVCAPIQRSSAPVSRYGSAKKKSSNNKISEELLQKIWESVRSNNGIIVLLHLMQIKTPITDADCIRGMACRALAGLSRSETVRQIVSKLPLFTNGQLQSLMRDPILQEKRYEHVQFQKYALELMERVSGKTKTANSQFDASLANIHKANVVAQTKIQFNEQQLHTLIHQHLLARGLTESAAALQREAGLTTPHPRTISHFSPYSYRSPSTGIISRSRLRNKTVDLNSSLTNLNSAIDQSSSMANQCNGRNDTTPIDEVFTSNTPIKLIKKSSSTLHIPQNTSINKEQLSTLQQRSLQKQISSSEIFLGASTTQRTTQVPDAVTHQSNNITLDTIITEYLTNQHALCKNPMSTCPQFDLFVPHKCPDPRPNKISGMCLNFADRFFRRHAGFNSRRLDRHLVHSNFSLTRTLRSSEPEVFFTCCDFTPCASNIVVGSYNGEVKVFSINECNEEYSHHCHESYINSIKCSRDGKLVITSGSWSTPMSALWNVENRQFSSKLQWDDEEYCEFSNVTQDKILGTKDEVATIYDLHTGQKIASLVPTIFNEYTKNRATFCPTDELILSDGVLWDVRSKVEIHKFDKLNQTLSGVFHPNNLEVVSNTEVWDLRTFHLLRTVPSLEQCRVIFSPQNVIYGITPEQETSRLEFDPYYESSFKTLDSYDYSSIATVDVKRSIYDLSVNVYGSQIAIVENQGGYNSVQESVVRVYSVGRKKNVEDEAEEEEEETDGSDDGSMSDTESVEVFQNRDNGDGDDNNGNENPRPNRRASRRATRRATRRLASLLNDDSNYSFSSNSSDSVTSFSENNDEEDNESDDDGGNDSSSWTSTSETF